MEHKQQEMKQKVENLIASMYGTFTNDFICIVKSKIDSMENAIALSPYDKYTRLNEFIQGAILNRFEYAGQYCSMGDSYEKMVKGIYLE